MHRNNESFLIAKKTKSYKSRLKFRSQLHVDLFFFAVSMKFNSALLPLYELNTNVLDVTVVSAFDGFD